MCQKKNASSLKKMQHFLDNPAIKNKQDCGIIHKTYMDETKLCRKFISIYLLFLHNSFSSLILLN